MWTCCTSEGKENNIYFALCLDGARVAKQDNVHDFQQHAETTLVL